MFGAEMIRHSRFRPMTYFLFTVDLPCICCPDNLGESYQLLRRLRAYYYTLSRFWYRTLTMFCLSMARRGTVVANLASGIHWCPTVLITCLVFDHAL
ncbi:hypothetical protein RRG08_044629 [Elysia crispata]|uniref:Uncharacterized protein n=1 Tax=Elysia crispata TaxID=231223 RepID=A0AAE0YNQ0_9GAST|nr:hypothetical protein RRG08_044629 [Elysia crispata]